MIIITQKFPETWDRDLPDNADKAERHRLYHQACVNIPLSSDDKQMRNRLTRKVRWVWHTYIGLF